MNANKPELTDDGFAELLALPASADEHPEAAALRSAVGSYRAETLQWAERRSATQPSLQPAARRKRAWSAVPQWSLAAVAVISIAAGLAHVYDRNDAGAETAAVAPTAVALTSPLGTSGADIAADNRLLSSIDEALSYHAVSPVDNLGPKPAHTKRTASGVID